MSCSERKKKKKEIYKNGGGENGREKELLIEIYEA
jgi:hypothetical protein